MTVLELAQKIATEAHAGQKRKFTGEPYITHPQVVVGNIEEWFDHYVRSTFHNPIDKVIDKAERAAFDAFGFELEDTQEAAIAAAWLHDVLEDTPWTIMDLEEQRFRLSKNQWELWKRIVQAVVALTKYPDENTETYLDYLRRVKDDYIARIVKLADLAHNMSDLKPGDKKDKYLLAENFLLT